MARYDFSHGTDARSWFSSPLECIVCDVTAKTRGVSAQKVIEPNFHDFMIYTLQG